LSAETWTWDGNSGSPTWRREDGATRTKIPATIFAVDAEARVCDESTACFVYRDIRVEGGVGGVTGKTQVWQPVPSGEPIPWFDAADPRFGANSSVLVTP
jgi:hypothetical protein